MKGVVLSVVLMVFLFAFSGTTCLIALLSDKELTVANVGDSRGVLCDKDGNAIPLSHDHKPYQLKERKRIKRAGKFLNRVVGLFLFFYIMAEIIFLYYFFPFFHRFIYCDMMVVNFLENCAK